MPIRIVKKGASQVKKPFVLGTAVFQSIFSEVALIPRNILVCSLIVNVLSVVMPFVSLQLYDRIIPLQALDTLFMLMLMMFGVMIIDLSLKTARSYLVSLEAAQSSYRIIIDAYARVLKAPASMLSGVSQSVWLERFQALNNITDYLGSPSRLIAVDVPFTMIFIGMMAIVGGWLAMIPILVFMVFCIIAHDHGNDLKVMSELRTREDAKIRDFFIETLSGVATIKGLGLEPQMQRRFERLAESVAKTNFELFRLNDESQNFGNMLSNLTQILTVSIGAVMVINEQISLGVLACCTLLSGRAVQPLARLTSVWNELQALSIQHDKIRPLRSLPPTDESIFTAVRNNEGRMMPSAILFENVRLAREDGKVLIQNMNLNINAGSCIAISGADGTGKSSILKLITGEDQPVTGNVYINGIDYDHNLNLIRPKISVVSSTSHTFTGTILENIALFAEGAELENARFAARLIGLESDIEQLPMGYDTILGEQITDQLPAGFTARILIARAIARKASILLFDEANASLDMVNDAALISGLQKLKGMATMVLITNRPSLAKIAEQTYVLENQMLTAVQKPDYGTSPAKAGGM